MADGRTSGHTNPLPSLIRASAWDAGNQSMRDAGRSVWSEDDYNASVDCQERLIRACYSRDADTDPRATYVRFGYAEAMQKAGLLTLSTKNFHKVLDEAFEAYCASFEEAA